MVYPLLLIAGFTGLIVMALLGAVHAPSLHRHGRAMSGHRAHPAAHPAAHGSHGAQPGAPHAPAHASPPELGTASRLATLNRGFVWLAPLLSPLTWFSWLFGAGAGGSIATAAGATPLVAIPAAVGGALAFQWGVVRPIWTLIIRFESKPTGNLDNCLFKQVEAVSAFNARGEGLVRVVIDGRTEDVLARLVAPDGRGRVRRGDLLVIQEVDPRTSACLVTRA